MYILTHFIGFVAVCLTTGFSIMCFGVWFSLVWHSIGHNEYGVTHSSRSAYVPKPANLNKFIGGIIAIALLQMISPQLRHRSVQLTCGLMMNHNNVNIPHLAFSLCYLFINDNNHSNIYTDYGYKIYKGHSHFILLLLCTRNALNSCLDSKWTIWVRNICSLKE